MAKLPTSEDIKDLALYLIKRRYDIDIDSIIDEAADTLFTNYQDDIDSKLGGD